MMTKQEIEAIVDKGSRGAWALAAAAPDIAATALSALTRVEALERENQMHEFILQNTSGGAGAKAILDTEPENAGKVCGGCAACRPTPTI